MLYADDLLLFRPIHSQEDYHHLQADMIEDWVNSNYLTLNLTKCKYMVVSQKRCPSAPVAEPNMHNLGIFLCSALLRRYYLAVNKK